MNFVDLKKSLEIGIKSAYYISGEDKFLRSNALKNILEKLDIANSDFNVHIFSEELDGAKVAGAISTLPLMSERKAVIIKEGGQSKNATFTSSMIEALAKPESHTTVIMVADDNDQIFKGLEKYSEQVNCDRLEMGILKKWISAELKKNNKTMSDNNISEVADRCNRFLTKINSELIKLMIYVGEREEITIEDIDIFIAKELEYKIYELTDSLAKRNKEKAYMIASDLIEDKKGVSKVLYLISSFYNRLFHIAVSDKSDSELAASMKMKEAAVKINKKIAASYTKIGLSKIVEMTTQADFNIKSGKSEIKNALYTLMLKIMEVK